jgi:hypothetical protein
LKIVLNAWKQRSSKIRLIIDLLRLVVLPALLVATLAGKILIAMTTKVPNQSELIINRVDLSELGQMFFLWVASAAAAGKEKRIATFPPSMTRAIAIATVMYA